MKVEKNPLEWTVFGVGVVLLAGVVGGLVLDAVRGGDAPPSLAIELGAPQAAGGVFRVPVQVENVGDATAESATVEVALRAAGREVERAEIGFAFVPRGSTRHGWVAFRTDPRCCELVARPLGFESP